MRIKKFFNEYKKPDKPFEVWAKENEISLINYKTVKKRKAFNFRWAASFTAIFILCCTAIILPFIFSGNDSGKSPQSKSYASTDALTQNIELSNIYQHSGLLLFDNILIYNIAKIEFVNEDDSKICNENSIILGYYLQECLVSINTNNNDFYFFVNYRIRVYENYNFDSLVDYSNLTQLDSFNNPSIYYRANSEENYGFINFIYQNNEYFLEVHGFDGITDINIATLNVLLANLFGGIHAAV